MRDKKLGYHETNLVIENRIEQEFTYFCKKSAEECCDYKALMRAVNKKLHNRDTGHVCGGHKH